MSLIKFNKEIGRVMKLIDKLLTYLAKKSGFDIHTNIEIEIEDEKGFRKKVKDSHWLNFGIEKGGSD